MSYFKRVRNNYKLRRDAEKLGMRIIQEFHSGHNMVMVDRRSEVDGVLSVDIWPNDRPWADGEFPFGQQVTFERKF